MTNELTGPYGLTFFLVFPSFHVTFQSSSSLRLSIFITFILQGTQIYKINEKKGKLENYSEFDYQE